LFGLADYPFSSDVVKQEWFTYRQALHDITTTYPNPVTDDDDNLIGITWPSKPTTK